MREVVDRQRARSGRREIVPGGVLGDEHVGHLDIGRLHVNLKPDTGQADIIERDVVDGRGKGVEDPVPGGRPVGVDRTVPDYVDLRRNRRGDHHSDSQYNC